MFRDSVVRINIFWQLTVNCQAVGRLTVNPIWTFMPDKLLRHKLRKFLKLLDSGFFWSYKAFLEVTAFNAVTSKKALFI